MASETIGVVLVAKGSDTLAYEQRVIDKVTVRTLTNDRFLTLLAQGPTSRMKVHSTVWFVIALKKVAFRKCSATAWLLLES